MRDMSHSARLLFSGVAAAATLAVAAPAALAAPVSAPNACYSMDGSAPQYGTLPLELTPSSVAQNGRQMDVGTVTPSVTVPSWLPDKMNSLGVGSLLLGQSKNVPVTAWMAVSPTGSTDGPRVVTTTGTVTVTVQGSSVKGVSLVLRPAPATSWRAADVGGTLAVSQGGPGSLASVPELAGAKPKGSLFIKGLVNLGFTNLPVQIDCQPGTNATPEDPASLTSTMLPGTPAVIASSDFAPLPAATPTPTPTPTLSPAPTPTPTSVPSPTATPTPKPSTAPQSAGVLGIASPSLTFGSAAVLVSVSCPAGPAPCTGSAAITSAKKLKVGKGAAKVRKLAAGTYSVSAGTTAPIKLKLSADGKRLRRKALVATVTLTPQSGAVVTKRLRANG